MARKTPPHPTHNPVSNTIRVAVIFGTSGRIQPVWFDWGNHKHTIHEITYQWQDRSGEATRYHFAVSDGVNLYELVYNTGRHQWTLATVETIPT